MIEVDVSCADYRITIVMLCRREASGKFRQMVVINDRYCRADFALAATPTLPRNVLPHETSHGLRTVLPVLSVVLGLKLGQ